MPTGITVPAAQVRAILDAAVDRGAAVGELCRAVGVDSATLDEADARLPLEAAIDMYETAARVVGDDSFGLHVAERSDWYAFDPLGYALATKANVKRAVEELAPTIAMMYATRIEMVLAGDEARLTYALAEEPSRLSRHRSEAFMARILRLIRIGLGRDVEARWVSFRHHAPADTAEHRRIFGDGVRFSEPANVLALAAGVVELPFVASDPRLSGIDWRGLWGPLWRYRGQPSRCGDSRCPSDVRRERGGSGSSPRDPNRRLDPSPRGVLRLHVLRGETPVAVVVPREGARANAEEIRHWANERLSKHQRAERVEFERSLPRNALGKVLKRELRDRYSSGS